MRIRSVKPFEIPISLLEQKEAWDLRVFYEYAVVAPNWKAWLIDDGDEDDPFGAVIVTDNALYQVAECQTIIVDKARRTPERVAAAAIIAHELTLEEARRLGRKYAGCGVKNAEKFMEILGNPPAVEILETVVREEV